ncbi:MAG TPA: hypothetical protein VF719_04785 [Abditibacteriaceae bacterium]
MTTNQQSGSPAEADVFPDFAISLEEAGRRVKMLKEFVRDHMVEGEDYGIIPGASPKPTLFKAGAEKLNAIFGLAPIVEITNRVEDWDSGFVAYEIKVTLLNKRTTNIEAEGIGSCNSRERRYKNQDAANIANTILKMSKKRALIDATLSATRASGLFTQDLEDMDREDFSNNARPAAATYTSPFTAARRSESDTPREASAASGFQASNGAPANGNALTEAQRGAILAIANKVFGRNTKDEMAKLIDKPITQLSKGEASALIDRLRNLLPEQPQTGELVGAERNGSALR